LILNILDDVHYLMDRRCVGRTRETALYWNRDRPLEEAELGKPARGIDPVLAVVGLRGDKVEGMTPSPD
jgi:hypothetical protein